MDNNQNPIVLGKVKKGKTGKPILAIIIIIFVGLLIYFLPAIQRLFKGESIIDLIKNGQLIEFIKNGGKLENNENGNSSLGLSTDLVKIENGAIVENNYLIIKDVSLSNNVLTFSISSKNATYDAKNTNLYLQVYEGKSKVIFTKSIDEVYTMTASAIKENVSTSGTSSTYYMALKVINTENIPDVELSSDESGLASITCTLDDDEYEYIFSKKLLVKIERKYSYRYNASNLNDYNSNLSKYRDLSDEQKKYGIESSVSEDNNGFTYRESVDLTKVNADIGSNYFQYNTEAKVVKFKQEAKGFDCE